MNQQERREATSSSGEATGVIFQKGYDHAVEEEAHISDEPIRHVGEESPVPSFEEATFGVGSFVITYPGGRMIIG